MLNEIRPPPVDPDRPVPPVTGGPHHHAEPHMDLKEPGLHHARVMGDATHINPEYAMPMEDRGSSFSIALTICVFVAVVAVLMAIFWSFYR